MGQASCVVLACPWHDSAWTLQGVYKRRSFPHLGHFLSSGGVSVQAEEQGYVLGHSCSKGTDVVVIGDGLCLCIKSSHVTVSPRTA